jgi:hypothetical protein
MALGWPVAAMAQGAAVSPDPIIVTGRGLAEGAGAAAYDSQVIDRETLLSSASGRIEDVLSGVAGFQQFRRSDSRSSNPSSQGVTLRALGEMRRRARWCCSMACPWRIRCSVRWRCPHWRLNGWARRW